MPTFAQRPNRFGGLGCPLLEKFGSVVTVPWLGIGLVPLMVDRSI